jgi:hypothetical protein
MKINLHNGHVLHVHPQNILALDTKKGFELELLTNICEAVLFLKSGPPIAIRDTKKKFMEVINGIDMVESKVS